MKKIKLRDNGSYTHIETASGKNIKANMLKVGKTYLHSNLLFLRTITEINSLGLYYEQGNRVGFCSAKHFARLCPNEATEDEIEFLQLQ